MNDDRPFDPDRLEEDPEGFFGLPPGYDARDLRRAYHAAIRRFRPDSHPREFQRIREAHDRLQRFLSFRGPARPDEDEDGLESARVPLPEPEPLLYATPRDREDAYRRLAAMPARPRDFVAAALLADTVAAPERNFEAWLLEGLARHPDDVGLESLLRIYVQDDLPEEDATRFLRRAATVLPGRVLWTVPRLAWETAADTLTFERFLALWKECHDPRDDLDEGPRARLLAHLFPRLVPKAPPEWVDGTMRWIADRADVLGDGGALLDALELWGDYRAALVAGKSSDPRPRAVRLRSALLGRDDAPARFPLGPVGDAVRELVHAMLAADSIRGGPRLSAAAREVARREAEVLRNFRTPDRPLAEALRFLPRAANLLAARHARFDPRHREELVGDLVYAAHRRAGEVLRWRPSGFVAWFARNLYSLILLDVLVFYLLEFVFLVTAIFCGISAAVNARHAPGKGLLFLVIGVVAGLLAWQLPKHKPKLFQIIGDRIQIALERWVYRRRVRAVAVEAIRDLGIAPEMLLDEQYIATERRNEVLAAGVASDPALRVLWVAHRFAG